MPTTTPEILITKKFPDSVTRPLEEIAVVHQWGTHPYDLMPRAEVMNVIGQMSAVINQAELKVDEEVLKKGRRLKIIANVSLGYDNLNLNLMTKYGVWASNTPGYFSYPVVEYVIGGVIAIYRKLVEADRFVRKGQWNSFQPGRWDGESLAHKTLGIIGMGSIGQTLARVATCLGMHVIYFSRSKSSEAYQQVSLEYLLSQADVVSVHVPYTTDTHEMLAAEQFSTMKPGGIFVNTSRGKVVHEADLVHALQTGHVGGAVLDVFSQEPLVPEALKAMPNVLLTPHVGGGTKPGRIACYQLAVDNVIEVMRGNSPLNPLNTIKYKP